MKTLKMTKAGRDRIRALAAQCDISMGEVVETLSFAQVDDVIRCGATKARASERCDHPAHGEPRT
jgi:hypothetical protein